MSEQKEQFDIQKIFVRDMSFESPQAPAIFTEQWQPSTDVNLSSRFDELADDHYLVDLKVQITAKQNDKVCFLIEVVQSGIFLIKGFEKKQQEQLLNSYCPNTLFPFLREVISESVTKGGFPPLVLAPVNFDALYAQKLAQDASGSSTTSTKH
jgi:preprotein translocase subunit SecB|tara:strand:- start:83448 stop:83906 length:459 start_codon:yes stop_codon:yes gene_type:complete